uniref:UBL3-like ubiquitin domain-containing protein n=1 Tax=Odontella aurita TaxID=265563 RepID=A0A6U6KZG2_9STRA|mmetsp:Transcript_63236/g.186983  ORF Transcript_63236/g.186983 Transcript_63236/m.186983 type:complete len:325 (+) Transcript_63236:234-1208(+)|eukprot:CAMPEP_0113582794 /NCGR_PEP_ID=MMETSP0015_2-20120614/32128_1 /TAXON_ID=2838 /ORGANISM="Odontella" /LENGTH=324 /DNA_ID=CAMNT_0000487537 /DNA_START=142 /DNA_END=1116 /DNA_ORIENTATION=+ /assembly_acc=CAM_ASM_000160
MGEEGPSAAAPSDTSAELSTEKEQLDPQRSMPSEEAETIDGGDVAPTLVDDDGRGKEREAADDYDAAPTEVDSAEEQTGAQQQSGETTDSSPDQTAGEEAGSEGSSYGEGENNPRQQKSPAPEADSSSSSAMADSNHSTAASSTAADSSAPTKCTGRAAPPPFVDDPSKITLRFIFANRDGLSVTVDLKPTDTVGEVKGALLSMWPDGKVYEFACMRILRQIEVVLREDGAFAFAAPEGHAFIGICCFLSGDCCSIRARGAGPWHDSIVHFSLACHPHVTGDIATWCSFSESCSRLNLSKNVNGGGDDYIYRFFFPSATCSPVS